MELHLHLFEYGLWYLHRAVTELTHRTICCTFFTFWKVYLFFHLHREACACFTALFALLYSDFLLFHLGLLPSVEVRQVVVLIKIHSVQQQDVCRSLFVASWHLHCPSLGSSKLCLNTQFCNHILLPEPTTWDPTWIRRMFPNFRVSRFQTCNGTCSESAFHADLRNSLQISFALFDFRRSYSWLRALEGRCQSGLQPPLGHSGWLVRAESSLSWTK